MPCTFPLHNGLRGSGSTDASNTANLMLEEPQFRTRTRRSPDVSFMLHDLAIYFNG
jgi:hypothetical protein